VTSELEDYPPRTVTTLQDPVGTGPSRFLNRELSWLDFAQRVLELAEDPNVALLERVKFLAIFSSGMDEFFQVRVAGLKDQVAAGIRGRSADGRTPHEQLSEIHAKATSLVARHARAFSGAVLPALHAQGIDLVDYASLDEIEARMVSEIFEREIFPVLTPLAVDPGHPFPYISNLSLNLAVLVEDPLTAEARFARVKVPPLLPRFVRLGDAARFVPLEQVIAANLSRLFPDMQIKSHYAFRVTRNAEFDVEETDADDLLAAVETELRRRRFGNAVRLEIDPAMDGDVLELLYRELEIGPEDVYAPHAPLDLAQLWAIAGLDRADLSEPDFTPMIPPRLADAGDDPAEMFAVLREHDVLLHHPYDSFASSVEQFITLAAQDPDVLAIKQTLYRTSGDARFVTALAQAAEQGKQVAALVELTARFDEQRNIAWARQLEEAGVHVVYGIVGLKTHSKTTLVVRREDDGIRRYCHIGTGNYNSDTARIYEDLGLLTADPDIGADLTDLFNYLTGFSRPAATRSLVLAPRGFRPWLLSQIAAEQAAGPEGRIVIKVNGLSDPEVIDALYRASQAGVQISLIVRGLCSLRPGVRGLSETITVRSIVGRFLEHSRIYRFGVVDPSIAQHCVVPGTEVRAGAHQARYFIGSGDMMQRNLDHRVEALVPVDDPELCGRLEDILTLTLADDRNAWELSSDGSWHRVPTVRNIAAQARLGELAIERTRRRRSLDA
jgi:polyphosphate kinase